MEKRKWNKDLYEARKLIPACPRCKSTNLELKRDGERFYVWCPECRRKNRIYKGLEESHERQTVISFGQ